MFLIGIFFLFLLLYSPCFSISQSSKADPIKQSSDKNTISQSSKADPIKQSSDKNTISQSSKTDPIKQSKKKIYSKGYTLNLLLKIGYQYKKLYFNLSSKEHNPFVFFKLNTLFFPFHQIILKFSIHVSLTSKYNLSWNAIPLYLQWKINNHHPISIGYLRNFIFQRSSYFFEYPIQKNFLGIHFQYDFDTTQPHTLYFSSFFGRYLYRIFTPHFENYIFGISFFIKKNIISSKTYLLYSDPFSLETTMHKPEVFTKLNENMELNQEIKSDTFSDPLKKYKATNDRNRHSHRDIHAIQIFSFYFSKYYLIDIGYHYLLRNTIDHYHTGILSQTWNIIDPFSISSKLSYSTITNPSMTMEYEAYASLNLHIEFGYKIKKWLITYITFGFRRYFPKLFLDLDPNNPIRLIDFEVRVYLELFLR